MCSPWRMSQNLNSRYCIQLKDWFWFLIFGECSSSLFYGMTLVYIRISGCFKILCWLSWGSHLLLYEAVELNSPSPEIWARLLFSWTFPPDTALINYYFKKRNRLLHYYICFQRVSAVAPESKREDSWIADDCARGYWFSFTSLQCPLNHPLHVVGLRPKDNWLCKQNFGELEMRALTWTLGRKLDMI